jgi:hypothetical protein
MIIVSKNQTAGEPRFEWAFGLQQIYDVALARLYRGDELIHIGAGRDEFPITIDDIKTAKANRDRYLRDGIFYPPLPDLKD